VSAQQIVRETGMPLEQVDRILGALVAAQVAVGEIRGDSSTEQRAQALRRDHQDFFRRRLCGSEQRAAAILELVQLQTGDNAKDVRRVLDLCGMHRDEPALLGEASSAREASSR